MVICTCSSKCVSFLGDSGLRGMRRAKETQREKRKGKMKVISIFFPRVVHHFPRGLEIF